MSVLRLRSTKLHVLVSFAVCVTVFLLAVFGESFVWNGYDADTLNLELPLSKPTSEHWLGTDELGRDVFSRVIVGARSAVVGPMLVAIGAVLLGNVIGLVAGFRGGAIDTLAMRWVDLMFAMPWLLVAIVMVGVTGGGYWSATVLLIVFFAPSTTRLIRGATLEERHLPYVEAARVCGFGQARIIVRHILPNVLPIVVADGFLKYAYALVAFSSLSFLGLGVPPGASDWGRMLAEGRTLVFANPGTALGPGLALVITAASANMIGEDVFRRFEQRNRLQ